ncbi:MAG: helix-turn-helix transcriptional regulator [Cyclobacteriaceae bacterium]|nr:helix-turn-helix transcriptional regulator [Cyclobacteriaceae bacterium HetDA_MAG_MS6]
MKADIPIFSPPQVRKKFLKDDKALDNKLRGDISLFSISRIEEIHPYLSLPNKPFRNTAHGFILVLSGAVQMNIDVMSQTLKQNMLTFTPAGQANSIEAISPETTGFFVTFHEHFFDNSQLASGLKNFSDLLNPDNFPLFQLAGGLYESILSICKRMIYLYHESESNLFLIKHYLLTVLSELKPVFQEKRRAATESSSRLVTEFKNALLENIKSNPKPADLAEILNVSINHLNKVLKSATQLSTSEWIAKRQIIEAQISLKHSNSSVAEIAHHLGFDDPSYFSKFFRRHTKVTPSQYRRE